MSKKSFGLMNFVSSLLSGKPAPCPESSASQSVLNIHFNIILGRLLLQPGCWRTSRRNLEQDGETCIMRSLMTCTAHQIPTWSMKLARYVARVVFENMVLRRIFGPRRDEVMGEWGRLHNEELNDLYSSPNIVRVIKSRRMRWAGHVARVGEERGVYRVLVGKPEGKRPLGRPRRRWVDNIRMDLQEVGYGYMDWIGLAQDRDRWRTLVSAVMNLRVP